MSMLTMPTNSADSHHCWSLLGTVMVAFPLAIAAVATLMAIGGRFGGPANALTTAWYVPLALWLVALVGAAVLTLANLHTPMRRRIVGWSVTAALGCVFALGSAQVTGLAHAAEGQAQGWQRALLGVGVVIYLVALVALVVAGCRATDTR